MSSTSKSEIASPEITEGNQANSRKRRIQVAHGALPEPDPYDFTPNIIVLLDRLTPREIKAAKNSYMDKQGTKDAINTNNTLTLLKTTSDSQHNNSESAGSSSSTATKIKISSDGIETRTRTNSLRSSVILNNNSIDSNSTTLSENHQPSLNLKLKSADVPSTSSSSGSNHLSCQKCGGDFFSIKMLKEHLQICSGLLASATPCKVNGQDVHLHPSNANSNTNSGEKCSDSVPTTNLNKSHKVLYYEETDSYEDGDKTTEESNCSSTDSEESTEEDLQKQQRDSEIEIIDDDDEDQDMNGARDGLQVSRTRKKRRRINYAEVSYLKCRNCDKRFFSLNILLLHRKVCQAPKVQSHKGKEMQSGPPIQKNSKKPIKRKPPPTKPKCKPSKPIPVNNSKNCKIVLNNKIKKIAQNGQALVSDDIFTKDALPTKTIRNTNSDTDTEPEPEEEPKKALALYRCALCEEAVPKAHKETHLKKCVAQADYKQITAFCPICNIFLKNRPSLTNHYFRKHKGQKKIPFPRVKCQVCEAQFKPWHIAGHMRKAHKSYLEEMELKRRNAGSEISGNGNANPNRDRVQKTGDRRPYACPVENCGKRFICIAHLNSHKNMQHREIAPVVPVDPVVPVVPVVPDVPVVPVVPDVPISPEMPVVPIVPIAPHVPVVSIAPVVPVIPVVSIVPAVPAVENPSLQKSETASYNNNDMENPNNCPPYFSQFTYHFSDNESQVKTNIGIELLPNRADYFL